MPTPDQRSLDTVLQRERQLRDEAARALREAEQRLAQVLAQTEALNGYRRETAQRWSTPAGQVTSVQQLLTANGFLQRLDQALAQQLAAQQRADALATQRRSELMAAEQRVAVVDKLVERRRIAHAAGARQREQKSTDESAQSLLANRASTLELESSHSQGI